MDSAPHQRRRLVVVDGVPTAPAEPLAVGTVPTLRPAGRQPRVRRRRTRPRSMTIAKKRLTREELRLGTLMFPPVEDAQRPLARGDCLPGGCNEQRPCPWVSCKYHLYLDVKPETGSLVINFPDVEPWDLRETCALDVAERDGITLEEVGDVMNVTRERIRQLEARALLLLRQLAGEIDPDMVATDAPVLHPRGHSRRRVDVGLRRHPERDDAIAARVAAGERAADLAAEYNLTAGHILYIARGGGPRVKRS